VNRALRFTLLGLAVVVVLFTSRGQQASAYHSYPRVSNAEIVWGEDQGIYGAKADGSNRQLITRYKGRFPTDGYFSPRWSTDGQSVTYWTAVSASCFVHVVSPTRGMRRTLRLGDYCNRDPAWSPDGRRIVFSHETPTHPISIVSLASGRVRRLTNPALGDGDFAPAWSPDGTTIAFERDIDLRTDRSVIYTTTLGGRGRRLTSGFSPSWSPDGRFIVFGTRDDAIYRINADGSGRRRLGRLPGMADGPSLSPDGRKILWSRKQSTWRFSIWVVNADGTSPSRLITVPGNATHSGNVRGVGWKPG
jgi:Tol biopolymer transport system component